MTKITKATNAQKAKYMQNEPKPLYPLYGFVTIDNQECCIEFLNEDNGPKYEIMSPVGKHFNDGGILHSLLCFNICDVKNRAQYVTIESCTEEC